MERLATTKRNENDSNTKRSPDDSDGQLGGGGDDTGQIRDPSAERVILSRLCRATTTD